MPEYYFLPNCRYWYSIDNHYFSGQYTPVKSFLLLRHQMDEESETLLLGRLLTWQEVMEIELQILYDFVIEERIEADGESPGPIYSVLGEGGGYSLKKRPSFTCLLQVIHIYIDGEIKHI